MNKIPKLIGKRITCEDRSHCFYRRSFKSVNLAIFVQSENHERIIPSKMVNYAKSPYKSVDRARDHYSNTEAGLGAKRKERQEVVRYNLSRQQCQHSRSNYRYKEIEEGESSNSVTTSAKCKVLNLLVATQKRILADRVQAIITYQSLRWMNAL